MSKFKLAIFASGRGSNAQKITEYFGPSSLVTVDLIVTNKRDAKVLDLGKQFNIPQFIIASKSTFTKTDSLISTLRAKRITHIILAGFLWLIPKNLIAAYPDKILNIHPALLPKYGGKGMYGHHVHKAVKANNEKQSGITIHLVNENYDEGRFLFQESVELTEEDTTEQIAKKVLTLEHYHYPRIIQEFLQSN